MRLLDLVRSRSPPASLPLPAPLRCPSSSSRVRLNLILSHISDHIHWEALGGESLGSTGREETGVRTGVTGG